MFVKLHVFFCVSVVLVFWVSSCCCAIPTMQPTLLLCSGESGLGSLPGQRIDVVTPLIGSQNDEPKEESQMMAIENPPTSIRWKEGKGSKEEGQMMVKGGKEECFAAKEDFDRVVADEKNFLDGIQI